MRASVLILASLCAMVCSCGRSPSIQIGGVGDDPAWISTDETRRVGEQLITNRYPQARLVSELGQGQTFTYRFATNGTVLPASVVVDRKTGKARFESSSY
jgi:hypothetical protein